MHFFTSFKYLAIPWLLFVENAVGQTFSGQRTLSNGAQPTSSQRVVQPTFSGQIPEPTAQNNSRSYQPLPTGGVIAERALWGYVGCQKFANGQQAIKDALAEKHAIVGTPSAYYIDWHQMGLVEYFGEPARVKDSRKGIQQNIWNLYAFGDGWWGTGQQIKVFCGDGSFDVAEHKDKCSTKAGHAHFVNSYSTDMDAIMFCDSWFRLGTLSAAMTNGKKGAKWDVQSYENRALTWISALVQKKNIGTWPPNFRPERRSTVYTGVGRRWMTTPGAIKYIGKKRTTADTYTRLLGGNADTWAWFAMTMYIQDNALDGEYPYLPYVSQYDTRFEWVDRSG